MTNDGGMLHHNNTLTDTSVGSELLDAGGIATEKWTSGTAKRGKSSKSHLSELKMIDVHEKALIQKGTLHINSITVSGRTLKKKKLDNMYIVFKTNDPRRLRKKFPFEDYDRIVLQLEGSCAELSTDIDGTLHATWHVKDLNCEVFENKTCWLIFELFLRKRKLLCISKESESVFTGPKYFYSDQFSDVSSDEYQFEEAMATYTLQVNARFTPLETQIEFVLNVGKFSEVKTPEEIKNILCDRTEKHELMPYMKETCITARHLLGNLRGNSNVLVKVFHCARLMTSRIQVLCGTGVMVVAELISTDQLPLPDQVDGDIPTLNPSLGERTVLIKNNKGDWAVVIGHWMGYRRGKEGKTFQRCIINNKGEKIVQEYALPTRWRVIYSIVYIFLRLAKGQPHCLNILKLIFILETLRCMMTLSMLQKILV